MKAILVEREGCISKGCGFTTTDSRYLELDYQKPRKDGGLNHIDNRILLCSPCNRAKSHKLTLSGLQALNKKNGWLKS